MKKSGLSIIVISVLFLFCGNVYGETFTIEGTWDYDSASEPKELTFDILESDWDDYVEIDDFDDVDIKGLTLEMAVIYLNNKNLIAIDKDSHDHSLGTGEVMSLTRYSGDKDDIKGDWSGESDGVNFTMKLEIADGDTKNFTMTVSDATSGDGTSDDDDDASDLCFIGVLK